MIFSCTLFWYSATLHTHSAKSEPIYLTHPNGLYKPIITYVSSICKCHFSVNLEIRQPIFYHIASPNNGNHLICSYFPLYLLCSPFALARRVDAHSVWILTACGYSHSRLIQKGAKTGQVLLIFFSVLGVPTTSGYPYILLFFLFFINNTYIYVAWSPRHIWRRTTTELPTWLFN